MHTRQVGGDNKILGIKQGLLSYDCLTVQVEMIAKLVKAGVSIPKLTGGFDAEVKDGNLVISRHGENGQVVGNYEELRLKDQEELEGLIISALRPLVIV